MRFSLPRLKMPQLGLPRLKLPRLPGMFIFAWLFAALKGWVMGSRPKDNDSLVMYDRMLLWLTFGLAAIGFIMVTSASMPVGQRLANDPFLFAKRDGLYIVLAFALAMITLRLPMEFWQRHSTAMLIASIVMLLIVLVVGSRLTAPRVGSRSGRCVFSRRSLPSYRCFATSPTIWCVKRMRCVTTCAAS